MEDFIDQIFPNTGSSDERSKNANRTLDVIHEQPGANFAEGTWWQAFALLAPRYRALPFGWVQPLFEALHPGIPKWLKAVLS